MGHPQGDVVEGLHAEKVHDDHGEIPPLGGVMGEASDQRRLAVASGSGQQDEAPEGGTVGDGGEDVVAAHDLPRRGRPGDDEW